MQKKYFLPTYLPYFFSDRYRKQTISFFRPNQHFTKGQFNNSINHYIFNQLINKQIKVHVFLIVLVISDGFL